mmetsp:Transcript_22814/g.53357  ORF Transcript_22814/g.53357 Transcript_22814/m.53357 type:complete len:254 (+) Transcript_22814:602-1363(+)
MSMSLESGSWIVCRSWSFHLPSPKPPCSTRMRSERRHAMGKRSKQLWMSSKVLAPKVGPNFCMHSSLKPYFSFMARSSWLPRTKQILSGNSTLYVSRSPMTSSWCCPLSTKSPLKTKVVLLLSSGEPKTRKKSRRSRSCPCKSPKTLQGALANASAGCPERHLQAACATSIRVSVYSVLNRYESTLGSSHSESSLSACSFLMSLASSCACFTTKDIRRCKPLRTVPLTAFDEFWMRFLRKALPLSAPKSRTRL